MASGSGNHPRAVTKYPFLMSPPRVFTPSGLIISYTPRVLFISLPSSSKWRPIANRVELRGTVLTAGGKINCRHSLQGCYRFDSALIRVAELLLFDIW
ncbi:hypothetical protein NPIL_276981 [Nephila pilipes]|uniref:Uncharacterized protein n=1 Tax=Nephila pilipes TaxID=299642 RepID=A0A8X6MV91_NEPPI|nr:hypothetical protein NPIL_276981 [Nephila pilipes]